MPRPSPDGVDAPDVHSGRAAEGLETRIAPATLPPGFVESTLLDGLNAPSVMEFAPDGRLFVAEQGGTLRVARDGALLDRPFLDLDVDSRGERGLIGLAFDPSFEDNGYVYVYYTVPGSPSHNRLSRFEADGDSARPESETVLLDLDPLSNATNHNGGALEFAPDGTLYVAVGENARPNLAQRLDSRLGKILRIRPDGTIPADNPFQDTAQGANRAIWALGLRNPFTLAVQPSGGTLFINDVGQSTFEEIDLGRPGANYGWPAAEGPTADPRFDAPPLLLRPPGRPIDRRAARSSAGPSSPSMARIPTDSRGIISSRTSATAGFDGSTPRPAPSTASPRISPSARSTSTSAPTGHSTSSREAAPRRRSSGSPPSRQPSLPLPRLPLRPRPRRPRRHRPRPRRPRRHRPRPRRHRPRRRRLPRRSPRRGRRGSAMRRSSGGSTAMSSVARPTPAGSMAGSGRSGRDRAASRSSGRSFSPESGSKASSPMRIGPCSDAIRTPAAWRPGPACSGAAGPASRSSPGSPAPRNTCRGRAGRRPVIVAGLYRDLLGRPSGTSEVEAWLVVLSTSPRSGRRLRDRRQQGGVSSPESRVSTTPDSAVPSTTPIGRSGPVSIASASARPMPSSTSPRPWNTPIDSFESPRVDCRSGRISRRRSLVGCVESAKTPRSGLDRVGDQRGVSFFRPASCVCAGQRVVL